MKRSEVYLEMTRETRSDHLARNYRERAARWQEKGE